MDNNTTSPQLLTTTNSYTTMITPEQQQSNVMNKMNDISRWRDYRVAVSSDMFTTTSFENALYEQLASSPPPAGNYHRGSLPTTTMIQEGGIDLNGLPMLNNCINSVAPTFVVRRYTEGSIPRYSGGSKKQRMNSNSSSSKEEDEEDKRKHFLEKNRQAALKCRQRKKQWLANLQHRVEFLSTDNEQLQKQATMLREKVINLKTLLLAHRDCKVAQANGTTMTMIQSSVSCSVTLPFTTTANAISSPHSHNNNNVPCPATTTTTTNNNNHNHHNHNQHNHHQV